MKEWNKPSMTLVILDDLMTDTFHCSGEETNPTTGFQLKGTDEAADPIFGEDNNWH